jgi:hypothetical protein
MKILSLVLSAFLFFTIHGTAQEKAKPDEKPAAEAAPSDPFVKEKGKKAEPGKPAEGPATMTNVGVVVQYIDVKRERWQKWLAENDAPLDATPLRKEVETWITAGDASLAETSLVMAKSGQRAKVESVRNVVFPGEFLEDPSGQPIPTALETRNSGTTTEVDPVLEADGSVEINFAPERVVYTGENSPREAPGVLDGDIRHPIFEVQKATLSTKVDPQSWSLVGCEQSIENADTHQTLIFTRSLLHHFEEDPTTAERETQGMLTWSWVEVTHDAINTSLLKISDPSSWVGGGLYEEVSKSGARILEARSHQFRNGLRSKHESIREFIYPTHWDKPKDGLLATPTAFETRNVGTTVEVDPVVSPNGNMLDLNMAPESTLFFGWDTLHRVLINGEWTPNVTMPAFYTMQPTTQLSLPINISVLVAVMSPPNEEGWADPSRKVLLFVKFSR